MKKKDLSDGLLTLITKMRVEAIKNNGDINSGAIAMLQTFYNVIEVLKRGYSSSSETLSWEKVNKSINLLMKILMDEWKTEDYRIINKEFLDHYYFIDFIQFVYNKNNWEECDYYDIKHNVTTLLLFFIPDEIVTKISMPTILLSKVNLDILKEWAYQKAYSIKQTINNKLRNAEFLETIEAFHIINSSVCNERKIKHFTQKQKRIVTYKEINEVMKNELEFWKNLFKRDNYKYTPNRKYSDEMFEFTTQKKLEGYKDYVAYQKTLEKYGMDEMKDDSFGKMYRNYIKNKKV